MARHERGTPAIRLATASLTGPKDGHALKPAKADRNDRTTRTAARVQTSNQDSRAPERVTEIGRRAAAQAAKADRRAVAPRPGGARPRGKERRKVRAVHAGHRESRDRCESWAVASRAAR
jgi:hypothetical protein